jgi:hypothetical protein
MMMPMQTATFDFSGACCVGRRLSVLPQSQLSLPLLIYACVAKQTLKEIQTQTGYAEKSASGAVGAAHSAQDAIALTKQNFRYDERPYIALAPAGDVGNVRIVQAGEHAGHLAVEVHLNNYGKSPAMELGRDARLAIGTQDSRHIALHPATDSRGRIIPTGNFPNSIYAYSDKTVTTEELHSIQAGNVLVIFYGHIDYTDLFDEPRPRYLTEFCTGIFTPRDNAHAADDSCKNHTQLK